MDDPSGVAGPQRTISACRAYRGVARHEAQSCRPRFRNDETDFDCLPRRRKRGVREQLSFMSAARIASFLHRRQRQASMSSRLHDDDVVRHGARVDEAQTRAALLQSEMAGSNSSVLLLARIVTWYRFGPVQLTTRQPT